MSGNGGDGRRGRLTVPRVVPMPSVQGPWTVEGVRGELAAAVRVLGVLQDAEAARRSVTGVCGCVGPRAFPDEWPIGQPRAERWDYPGEAVAVVRERFDDGALDRAIEVDRWLATIARTSLLDVVWARAEGWTWREVAGRVGLSLRACQKLGDFGLVLVTDAANRAARRGGLRPR